MGEVVRLEQKNRNIFTEGMLSAEVLSNSIFNDEDWLVDDLLPHGLTLLVGDSKIGKSFLALQLSVSVASDGLFLNNYDVNPGSVVYLSWEDGARRIQKRINRSGMGFPKDLYFNFNPDINGKDLFWIEECVKTYPNIKLIVLDTIAYLRSSSGSNADAYIKDVTFMKPFHKMTTDLKISILAVTHTNQATKVSDDYHQIQGSTGQPGTADSVMFLSRNNRASENGKLKISGRDIRERTLNLSFEKETCLWMEKSSDNFLDNSISGRVLAFLITQSIPLPPVAISESLGISNCNKQLERLLKKGLVTKYPGGSYCVSLNN